MMPFSNHNYARRAKKKTYYLGVFDDLEKAAMVRKKAESVLYDEFLDWYNETFPQKQGREETVNK